MAHLEVKPKGRSTGWIWLIIIIIIAVATFFLWKYYNNGKLAIGGNDTVKKVSDTTKVTTDSVEKNAK